MKSPCGSATWDIRELVGLTDPALGPIHHGMNEEKLTFQDFEKLVDSVFTFQTNEEPVDLKLVEVTDQSNLATKAVGPDGSPISSRDPFVIVFVGPKDRLLADGLYTITHPELKELLLFVKPYQEGPDGYLYEAVFN